ncbi:unnamed protein product [Rotaria sp. Silwood2]|nr:unnamed protein product [Rotaria sp. Silwood2]
MSSELINILFFLIHNINSLVPDDDQLGTCLHGGGGGDAASAHYICTQLKYLNYGIYAIEKERADEISEVTHYTIKKAAGDNKSHKKQTTKPECVETKPVPNDQYLRPIT